MTEVPLSKGPNPQLLPWGLSIKGCPLLRVCVHGVCVFTAVCVHFEWVKCRAQILSMGHHTWPLTLDCFLNEGQIKASFVKKLNDPATLPEEVSPPLSFFMIICKSSLLFHRREGRGEQSSLACKEICTETSHCVLLHAH